MFRNWKESGEMKLKMGVYLTIGWLAVAGWGSAATPETPKRPVTDTYHDVTVADDYRWLEDWENTEVRAWSEAQNAHARSVLDNLPNVEAIRKRVTEIMSAKTVGYGDVSHKGDVFLALKSEPPKQQAFLVARTSLDASGSERVLVDPNTLDPAGSTTIDWYVLSHDGKLVAVSLSKKGTESGDIWIFDTATGKQGHEVIPRVNGGTAGGDVAFAADGQGLFYTRYPRGTERKPEDMDFYMQLYFHPFGTPTAQDRYEMGRDLPRIAEIEVEMNPETGDLLATVQNGDGGEFAFYLRSPEGKWRQISRFEDKAVQATFGPGGVLFLISVQDAPKGKILRMPVRDGKLSEAKTIVPESQDTILTSFYNDPPTLVATESRLFVVYQLGGPSQIRVFDLEGKPLQAPEQPAVASLGGLAPLGGDVVAFSAASYTTPNTFYRFDGKTNETVKTALGSTTPVDLSDAEVRREFAVSKDGTKIPVNIVLPKGVQLDGKNPCFLTGYGGFGTSMEPRFSSMRRILLDQGMIFVQANIRGGGEYGEEWHKQGNLTNKQNVFDDFFAAMRYLVEKGYTSPDRLVIEGGSNGGLLMGAMITQHPDAMRVVVSSVGIYDMLRVELSPNGSFNIPEYGTVKDKAQFDALYEYSPYHHVKTGTAYPATLFMTGANDPRVQPMQSRKMTARLQAATSSKAPILLRTSDDTGHGMGTPLSARIDMAVDEYAFIFSQLGIEFKTGK